MFECPKCGKLIKYKSNLYRHCKMCDIKKFETCKICGKKFNNHSELMVHRTEIHCDINKKEEHECPICHDKLYCSKGTFTNHIKNHDSLFLKHKGEKISKAKKEFFADEERSKEYLEALSKRKTGQVHTEETKKKISNSMKKYINSLSPDDYSKFIANYINAPLRGHNCPHTRGYTPTRPEQIVIDLQLEGLTYNGNNKNAIAIKLENQNYKKTIIPDFIYQDSRKFIEVFGVYWHSIEDEEKYIKAYNENGFEVLIIWENDLYNNLEIQKERIINFLTN